MDDLFWLFLANVVVWLGLGGYLLYLNRLGGKLEKRLRKLEEKQT